MSNCQTNIEIHKESGSSQANRLLNALRESSIKIDERKMEDLILFTNKLSQNIYYYSKDNVILGSWESFFQWESTSILAQISKIDIENFLNDLTVLRRKLILIDNLVNQQELVFPFFTSIHSVLDDLYRKINQLPTELKIKEYYKSTYPTLIKILDSIHNEVTNSTDLTFTLQHHLFNKKIQNFFGLLTDWKNKSSTSFQENLKSYANHTPQYALYLAFLKLFEIAQKDLNSFTKRHLNFYYKDVLHLKPRDSKPDFVHICIEPHKNTLPFLIEKDTVFLANKNKEGQKKYYKSIGDSTINQVQLNQIYGGFKKEDTYFYNDLTKKNATDNAYKTFTEDHKVENFGFAIASPLFFLNGGKRTIRISFKDANKIKKECNFNNYHFYLTGEKEWIEVIDVSENNNTIILTLESSEKAIIPFNSEIHKGSILKTNFPVLKIITKDGKLNNFSFSTIDIGIKVKGLHQFNLYSDTGIIDSTKPFKPFGPIPKTGNSFVFSCKEFFQKKGAKGALQVTTDNSSWNLFRNSRLTFLENGEWIAHNHWYNVNKFVLSSHSHIPYNFTDNEALTKSDTKGFAKIILKDNQYSKENYLASYILAAKSKLVNNLPYVPTIETISFDYSVNQTITPNNQKDIDLIQLYPYGYEKLNTNIHSILPRIINEGEIFIGLKNVKAGNTINLLFQLEAGSANPRQEPATIKWCFLDQNNWIEITADKMSDETVGLTQSGIVQIKAPHTLKQNAQTILPNSVFWIKIEIPTRIDAICNFIGIHTQALKSVLYDFENIGIDYTENTAAKTIRKLLNPKNEIKKIKQPYESFKGRIKDNDNLFYQRTSERLRHKDRAITTWDYEKLILDNFPEVFRVKCLNHYRYDSVESSNTSAGYVTIVPVAKSNTSKLPNYWKPIVDLGTMKRIKAFLKQKASPHVRILVKAPRIEKIQLDFRVKYKDIPGSDTILNKKLLENTINSYLSPWLFNKNTPITFQTLLEKSKIIQLIEKQSYVDFISEFKVNQLILAENSEEIIDTITDVKEIISKTDFTLFIPHDHKISTIDKACCL